MYFSFDILKLCRWFLINCDDIFFFLHIASNSGSLISLCYCSYVQSLLDLGSRSTVPFSSSLISKYPCWGKSRIKMVSCSAWVSVSLKLMISGEIISTPPSSTTNSPWRVSWGAWLSLGSIKTFTSSMARNNVNCPFANLYCYSRDG